MPIEDKPSEIRARVRDPNDFTEVYGYTDIEKEKGIRAIYGKLQTGGNAIQAYRFNKAYGWTVEKAKKWLSEHDIKTLKGNFQIGPEHEKQERSLLKHVGPKGEMGENVNLLDVYNQKGHIADKLKPIMIGLAGDIIQHGMTQGPITLLVHENDKGLEPVIREAMPKNIRERLKFSYTRNLKAPYLPMYQLQMQEMNVPDTIMGYEPQKPKAGTYQDYPLHYEGSMDKIEAPCLAMEAQSGIMVQLHRKKEGLMVYGEDGMDLASLISPEALKELEGDLEDGSILIGMIKPSDNPTVPYDNLLLLDAVMLDGKDISQTNIQARIEALRKYIGHGQKNNYALAPYTDIPNKERLKEVLKAGAMVQPYGYGIDSLGNAPGLTIYQGSGEVLEARVLAGRQEQGPGGEHFSYLLGVEGPKGLIPIGMTSPSKLLASKGDLVRVMVLEAGVYTDKRSNALWLDGQMVLLNTHIHSNLDNERQLQNLIWKEEGQKGHMGFPDFLPKIQMLGSMGREWENHIAEQRYKAFIREALDERIFMEKLGAPISNSREGTIALGNKGRFVIQEHKGTDNYPSHLDIRLQSGNYLSSWAIFNNGKPCCCEKDSKPNICYAMPKATVPELMSQNKEPYFITTFGTYEITKSLPNEVQYKLTIENKKDEKPKIVSFQKQDSELWLMKSQAEGKNLKEILTSTARIREISVLDGNGKEALRAYNFALHHDKMNGASRYLLHVEDGNQLIGFEMGQSPLEQQALDLKKLDNPLLSMIIMGSVDGCVHTMGAKLDWDMLDIGKVIIMNKNEKETIFEFRGQKLRGKWKLQSDNINALKLIQEHGTVSDLKLPLRIKCLALSEGLWNGKFWPRAEIQKAILSPFPGDTQVRWRTDHSDSVWDIIGTVRKIWFEPNHDIGNGQLVPALMAEADINDEVMARAIMNGDVTGVSVGTWVNYEDGNPPSVKDIEIKEISSVSVPACNVCKVEGCAPAQT